jgi:phospholipid/cholesterol/gamma-HCH transport system substrate-binding protein
MRTLGRHPLLVGVIGATLIAVLALGSLNYDKLPFFNQDKNYLAYFAEAGGLAAGAPVQVSGFRVGQITSVELDGPRVLVKFGVNNAVRLGDRSEAAAKTKTVLGAKILEITPRGDGELAGPIPLDRTRSAYQLPDALGDLASTISGLNTNQLSDSLSVLATTFQDSAPDLRIAVQGVARYSKVLNARDGQLRNLLANANKVTGVLAERGDRVVSLIADANALLLQLQSQSSALDEISANISAVSRQVQGFIGDNRQTLKPALDKLNGVLAIVDNHKEQVQKSIKLLNSYSMSLGESVSSGPFFKAYVTNLLPGQFLQPFIDAAFSDLGLDPNVLAPTKLNDPQVGQPGTPALPIPYPRTGQGGEPNLNLPDAITGKPGDQGCGPPGVALPGPTGCYPYREPPPAPPPGGPPPGPPAPGPAQPSLPEPTLGEPPPPPPGGAQ